MAQRRLGFWRRLAVVLVLPLADGLDQATWTGMENLPPGGGVILVPNHMSHFDPLVVAHYIYGAGRWPRFLGKASMWKVPVLGFLLRKAQQIPVERGSVEAVKSLDALVDALQAGRRRGDLSGGHDDPGARPVADARQDRRGPARPAHRRPGGPDGELGRRSGSSTRAPTRSTLRPRTPVTRHRRQAGRPEPLGRAPTPTRAVLEQMTETIMTDVRDLLAELRDETPPPLYDRPARRAAAAGDAE